MAVKVAKALMQTSASARSKRRRVRRNEGFTLIELLVVVAIIGILAGLAFPYLRIDREAFVVEREAERFAERVALARDEAMLIGQPLALEVTAQQYRFARPVRGNDRSIEWISVDHPRALAPHSLETAHVSIELSIRGEPQALAGPPVRLQVSPTGDFTPFSMRFESVARPELFARVGARDNGQIDLSVHR